RRYPDDHLLEHRRAPGLDPVRDLRPLPVPAWACTAGRRRRLRAYRPDGVAPRPLHGRRGRTTCRGAQAPDPSIAFHERARLFASQRLGWAALPLTIDIVIPTSGHYDLTG